jgi:hypothetical protein
VQPNALTERLVQLLGRSPADVLAARALAAVEPFAAGRLDDSFLTAPEALDAHGVKIGAMRSSVEYFG